MKNQGKCVINLLNDVTTVMDDDRKRIKERETGYLWPFPYDDVWCQLRENGREDDIAVLEILIIDEEDRNKRIGSNIVKMFIEENIDKLILVSVGPVFDEENNVEYEDTYDMPDDVYEEQMKRLHRFYTRNGFIEVPQSVAFTEAVKLYYYPNNDAGRFITEKGEEYDRV